MREPRLILFGVIPAIIPVIPEVPVVPADPIIAPEEGTVSAVSPVGVLDLVDYSSSSDSDPLEDSLPPAPDLPLVSPFCVLMTLRRTRFDHRPLARTPRHSEAFRRWRLSRKRCRSPTASVPSPTHVSRSISPTPADLLQPRKRFKDSYSPEDSGEEHIEVDTTDAEAVADAGISEGVVAHPEDGVGIGFKIAASDVREDDEEFEAEASAADTRETVVDPFFPNRISPFQGDTFSITRSPTSNSNGLHLLSA
ncbi:hypothetical protein Tco_0359728 [Tanacetum coccineum]